jgi:hypothetical protein
VVQRGGNPTVLSGWKLVARALLCRGLMKPQNATDPKISHGAARLPRGVVQKAAHRVGLTRGNLLSTSCLLMAGLVPELGRR